MTGIWMGHDRDMNGTWQGYGWDITGIWIRHNRGMDGT